MLSSSLTRFCQSFGDEQEVDAGFTRAFIAGNSCLLLRMFSKADRDCRVDNTPLGLSLQMNHFTLQTF